MDSWGKINIWKKIGISLLIGISIGFYGCRSLAEPPAPSPAMVAVEIPSGVTPAKKSKATKTEEERQLLLQYHLAALSEEQGPSIIGGNNVRLLIDGPAAYDAIFSAIGSAKQTVDIEMYIFDGDSIGAALAELLRKKSKEGIRVRLIYDSVGCLTTPRSFFDEMNADGVMMVEFHPVNPLAGKFFSLNNRDHRKIIIVDNRVAYTGGINISSVYTHGSGFSRKSGKRDPEKALQDGWRDTQIEITGPAVAAFSDLYDAMWMLGKGAPSLATPKKIKMGESGKKYVRVIGSSPEDEVNFIYADLLNSIKRARHSIHITMSYFSPNKALIEELKAAAQRGVDVQLVLPGFSDWWPVLEAGRSHYNELLDAGVDIYERKDAFLHAKTAVIDGIWSTVGSSNMDVRSFLHNYEINVVILGDKFGDSMEEMFTGDRSKAELITKAAWQERPLMQRIKQRISWVFSYWL